MQINNHWAVSPGAVKCIDTVCYRKARSQHCHWSVIGHPTKVNTLYIQIAFSSSLCYQTLLHCCLCTFCGIISRVGFRGRREWRRTVCKNQPKDLTRTGRVTSCSTPSNGHRMAIFKSLYLKIRKKSTQLSMSVPFRDLYWPTPEYSFSRSRYSGLSLDLSYPHPFWPDLPVGPNRFPQIDSSQQATQSRNNPKYRGPLHSWHDSSYPRQESPVRNQVQR